MRKLLLLVLCVGLSSVAVFAQTNHKGEAYFGYSGLTAGKNGWSLSGGYNLGKPVVLVGDMGGYYSDSNNIHTFMGGVIVHSEKRRWGFDPFGRFLLGEGHVSKDRAPNDNSFTWAIGGGLDMGVMHNFGVRLSVDALHTHFYNDSDFHLRAGFGVLYHF